MSSHKAMTFSMESLNKLYFQFFQRTVIPNLKKQINQITQLLRQKTACQVHHFLEEKLAGSSDNYSTHTNSSVNSTNGSYGSLNSISSNNYTYQYAIPSQVDHSKNLYIDNSHNFDKSPDKQIQQSVSFKSKLGMRRVQTGLAYQDSTRPHDPFEYKHIIDDNLMIAPSLSTNYSANEGLISIRTLTTGIISDFRLDYGSNKKQNDSKKSKIMRQQVRKISKIFNQGHTKIQKYTKNGVEVQNKLLNLNVSTKLQKRQSGTWAQDYPIYQQRQEIRP